MRKSKTTAAEIEAVELAADTRKRKRGEGFALMSVRDRGWKRLSNGVLMEWQVDRPLEEYEVRTHVPNGMFKLDGKMYDADDFRKYLRWV